MRIISQDRTIDIPYDYFSFSVASGKCKDVEYSCIYCYNISASHGTKLAEYSSREKALKAMEMLRERHTDNIFCIEDIQYKAEMLLDDGLQIVREMMMKYEYFQFPKDDEIEV